MGLTTGVSFVTESATRVDTLLILALRRPAWFRNGEHVVPAAVRVWSDVILQFCERRLQHVLERGVHLRLLPKADKEFNDCVFAVRISSSVGMMQIALDRRAGLALSNALSVLIGGSRGGSYLSESDRGLLEYLGLDLSDAVALALPDNVFTLDEFSEDEQSDGLWSTSRAYRLGVQVEVSGQQLGFARVRIRIPVTEPLALSSVPVAADDEGLIPDKGAEIWQESVFARYLAQQVLLDRAQLNTAAPGDVLLTGVPTMDALMQDGKLVTDTGWCVAQALHAEDHPDFVTMVPAAIAPRPSEATANAGSPDQGREYVDICMGEGGLSLSRLRGWSLGESLTLAKPDKAPILLNRCGVPWMRGEPVAAAGEIGIRLLPKGDA